MADRATMTVAMSSLSSQLRERVRREYPPRERAAADSALLAHTDPGDDAGV
jgi:hypothetical protein